MRVAILGAGLQGVCAALQLAAQGVRVELFDSCGAALTGASEQNEGKIHLGFVYAADPSLATAAVMIRGAASFAPLLRRWLGAGIDCLPVSSSFYYLVHAKSILSIETIRSHLAACRALALEYPDPKTHGYFGSDFHKPSRELPTAERNRLFDTRNVVAAFQTPEVGIDPKALATALREFLPSVPEITLRLNTRVVGVKTLNAGATVQFECAHALDEQGYDHVVNALWAGRLLVDKSVGLSPGAPWLWRVKHYLRVTAPYDVEAIPSATIILGPFGDIVNYGNREILLSWYPDGCADRSSAIEPPSSWLPANRNLAAQLRRSIPAGLAEIVPGVERLSGRALDEARVQGGIIFARGKSDVSDPASGLHKRHDIGVQSMGRYHSINTGKYTTAPLFAAEVASRVMSMK